MAVPAKPVATAAFRSGPNALATKAAAQTIGHQRAVRFRNYQLHPRIRFEQRAKSVWIKMIRVIVTGGGDIDKIETFGRHHPCSHAHVRLVRLSVFFGEGIRKIGIEQKVAALPLHQEPALAQPPEVQVFPVVATGGDVGQESIVLSNRLEQVSIQCSVFSIQWPNKKQSLDR